MKTEYILNFMQIFPFCVITVTRNISLGEGATDITNIFAYIIIKHRSIMKHMYLCKKLPIFRIENKMRQCYLS